MKGRRLQAQKKHRTEMFCALPSECFEIVSIDLENQVYLDFLAEKGLDTKKATLKGSAWKVISDIDADALTDFVRASRVFAVRDSRDLMLFTGYIQNATIELDDGRVVERDGDTTVVVSGSRDGDVELELTKEESDALFKHRVQLPSPLLTIQEGAAFVSKSTFVLPGWFTHLLGGYLQSVFRLHCLINRRRMAIDDCEMRPLVVNSAMLNCKPAKGGHLLTLGLNPHSAMCICGKKPIDDPSSGRSNVAVNMSFCGSVCNNEFCASGCTTPGEAVIDPELPLICHSGLECEIVCDHGGPFRQTYRKVLPVAEKRAARCFATIAKALAAENDGGHNEHMKTVLESAVEVDIGKLCEEATVDDLAERDQVCLDVIASPATYTVVSGKHGWRFKKRDEKAGRKQRQAENSMLSSHGHLCR